MNVFALIGPSGTGKSHRASLLAYREGIEHILDDGLLIKGSQVLAGFSAKRETTRMGATKRAIFHDPEQAREVREKIKTVSPKNLLILGISQRMVEHICERLDLPYPIQIFHIEDIASPEEIARAVKTREKENRHVIPIPTFAIEKDFKGFLLDPIKALFLSKIHSPSPPHALEHSIVRPLYSTLGNYFISAHVIDQIAAHTAEEEKEILRARRSSLVSTNNGMILNMDVVLKLGEENIPCLLKRSQKKIKENLEYYTGFQVCEVNITARRIVTDLDQHKQKKAGK